MKQLFCLKSLITLCFLLSCVVLFAQEESQEDKIATKKKKIKVVSDEEPPLFYKGDAGGIFSFGLRSTYSTLSNNNWSNTGLGVGGSVRLQFSPRISSEYFFDYLSSDIQRKASRTDYNIGGYAIFYPFPKNYYNYQPFRPYLLLGYCASYARISENKNPIENNASRWSSAIHTGFGTHINFNPRTNMSFTAQYLIHLGNNVNTDIAHNSVIIKKKEGVNFEGHLLFTLGIHYKIVDLW